MIQGLVSIIMPVYGVEAYIGNAITSVINQTYPKWELIIVNDGTKDRSREIASEYAQNDDRIRVVDKPNGGLSDARNFGLQFVSGEYLHFFDSDDTISPDFYCKLLAPFKDIELDMIVCGYKSVNFSENNSILESTSCYPPIFDEPKDYLWSEKFLSVMTYAWNKVYRSDFILGNKLQFTKGLSYIEDIDFINKVLKSRPNIYFLQDGWYEYAVRNRVTLSRGFSKDTMSLELQRYRLTEMLLGFAGVPDDIIKMTMSKVSVRCLRGVLHTLFAYVKPMKHREYRDILRSVSNSEVAKLIFDEGLTDTRGSNLIIKLLRYKLYDVIILLYKLKKYLR